MSQPRLAAAISQSLDT